MIVCCIGYNLFHDRPAISNYSTNHIFFSWKWYRPLKISHAISRLSLVDHHYPRILFPHRSSWINWFDHVQFQVRVIICLHTFPIMGLVQGEIQQPENPTMPYTWWGNPMGFLSIFPSANRQVLQFGFSGTRRRLARSRRSPTQVIFYEQKDRILPEGMDIFKILWWMNMN